MCVVQNLYTKAKCKEKKSCDLKHIGEFIKYSDDTTPTIYTKTYNKANNDPKNCISCSDILKSLYPLLFCKTLQ